MLGLQADNIPAILKEKKQWVGFQIIEGGKKVPIDPKPTAFGSFASISDPQTWGSFAQAVKTVEVGLCVGIGYAITKEDGLIFIDLDCHSDKCETEDEKVKLEKLYASLCESVKYFDTYMERSLSGNGVHLLAKGELLPDYKTGSSTTAPIEIYDGKRFILMTGHRLTDFDISDEDKTIGGIRNLQKQFFTKKAIQDRIAVTKPLVPIATDPLYTDEQVLEVALRDAKFQMLWENRWDEVKNKDGSLTYTQQHYADFALVKKLAYYTGNNPEQIERLFRASPTYQAYGHGKWEKFEKDIKKDIANATQNCRAIYIPKVEGKVVSTDWQPDFDAIYTLLNSSNNPLKTPALTRILQDYILKYQYQNPRYIPYLFKEDRNVNGATNIVKKVVGDHLMYSRALKGYFLWDGKRFANLEEDLLINPITNTLGAVEHSVFQWTMEKVVPEDDGDKDPSDKGTSDKGASDKDASSEVQEAKEKKAIGLFAESKKFVSVYLAKNVLLKLKGMDIGSDIKTYYETPYINMQNGVLDLEQRKLLPHDPVFRLYKLAGCYYDPDAACPTFEEMVARIMPDEADRRELQKAFGLCLAKQHLPAKKALMLLVGPKDTGKTTLLNTVVDVLGEYGSQVDNSLLMQSKRNKTVGPEMLDFKDVLMITTSETGENDRLDTSRVKSLTGETVQSVRNNFATTMEKFKMTGLIFIDSNHKPYIPKTESATWDRLRLFPFLHPVTQKDPKLKEKLQGEKSGIFNWLLKGLDMILEDGEIKETPNMVAFKNDYQDEMDITGQFFKECVEETESKGDKIQTSILFSTYKNWCKDNGFFDSVRTKFYEECGKRFEKKKSGVEYFTRLKFTPLGVLYCGMAEKTPQQFAKAKRMLLQGETTDITYKVARDLYFEKSWGWFVQNIRPEQQYQSFDSLYYKYNEWCIDYGLVPIKSIDFNTKLSYMFQHMKTRNPDADLLDQVKNVWHDNS